MIRFLIVAASLLLGSVSQADYIASTDFDDTSSNPNGVWSYGYTSTLGNIALFEITSATVRQRAVLVAGAPLTYLNPGPGPLFGAPAGGLLTHPGATGNDEFTVTRFSAPTDATYDVTAFFGAGDSGNVDLYVLKNSSVLFSRLAATSDTNFSVSGVSLQAGDTIDLLVGRAGDFGSDNTPIELSLFQVTAVPEPSTLLSCMAIGLVGLVKRRSLTRCLAIQHR